MPNEVDPEVLRKFVEGDPEAFESLFRQFEIEVYRWILRIVRDASNAEDVLVEVFWRAYRARARFDPTRSFGAWMRTIATNAAHDHLRASRPLASRFTRTDGIGSSPTTDYGLNESVARAFRRLPPRRPYAEIADALNLPVGTVKSRAFRAVRALRKELARMGIRP